MYSITTEQANKMFEMLKRNVVKGPDKEQLIKEIEEAELTNGDVWKSLDYEQMVNTYTEWVWQSGKKKDFIKWLSMPAKDKQYW